MKNAFVLITAEPQNAWAKEFAATLQPLGKLKIIAQRDFSAEKIDKAHTVSPLFIIDAIVGKEMTGLIKKVRQSTSQGRVIVMTASPNWHLARAAFEAGALDYLSKNLHPEEVLNSIRAVLSKPVVSQTNQESTT